MFFFYVKKIVFFKLIANFHSSLDNYHLRICDIRLNRYIVSAVHIYRPHALTENVKIHNA